MSILGNPPRTGSAFLGIVNRVGNLLSKNLQPLAWSSIAALLWFTSHTVPKDKLSIIDVAILLLLVAVAVGVRFVGQIQRLGIWVFALAFFATFLSAVSSFVLTGDLTASRDSLLIFSYLLLGASMALSSQYKAVLAGLGVGTLLVHLQGWISQWSDASRELFDGDYQGVTGRESDEALAAILGLAVGIALLSATRTNFTFPGLLILVNLAMVVRIDLSIGFVAVASLAASALGIYLQRKFPRRVSPRILYLLGGGLIIVFVVLVFLQRSLGVWVGRVLGASRTITTRYEIWDATLESANAWGFLFGHGASFWLEDSESRTLVSRNFAEAQISDYADSHSMYVDLFLALGLVGSLLLLALVGIVLRAAYRWSSHERKWNHLVFPWIMFAALSVLGVSESVLVLRAPGWLLSGFLAGSFLHLANLQNQAEWQNKPPAH